MLLFIIKNYNRIIFIDEIRGLCIVLMVIYHYSYDIFQIYQIKLLDDMLFSIVRDIFAGTLILISGVSCNFSKNNILRGIKCFSCGMGITLITYIFFPEQLIVFGVLHMLGLSMIFYGFFQKILKKINCYLLMILFPILFVITFNIINGYIGINNIFIAVPKTLYDNKFLFPVGIISNSFSSADYFPMFPWIFLFLFGTVLGSLKNKNEFPHFMYLSKCKFLEKCGKHTLLIYILHQPIFYLFLYLFKLC